MCFVPFQFYGGQFFVRHFDPRLVAFGIEPGPDLQASLRRCASNQLDDRLQGCQWLALPVLGDVAEETVLDLVPLTPLQQNLWVPRRRDSPRILTSNKLYPILMGIKVVATSQLPIQTSDLRGQRLRRGCPW